jgi:hypothetical protein
VGAVTVLVDPAAVRHSDCVDKQPDVGDRLRAIAAESAGQVRGVLDELADPDTELTAHAGTRSRLEGAALALEAVSRE